MIAMHLTRRIFAPEYTQGILSLGDHVFHTIEDAVREYKIPGKTAIPKGKYAVTITHSPRFGKRLPLLHNVPGFIGVRIHSGNTAKDTEGCILVGLSRGEGQIFQSRDAMRLLMDALATDTAWTIEVD